MNIKVNWLPEEYCIGTSSSGYGVLLRGDSNISVQRVGLKSLELVLLGLGSCTTFSVIHILRKSKIDIAECRTLVSVTPEGSELNDLETIQLHFDFFGRKLSEPKVNRALTLGTEKYCPVTKLLRRAGIIITHAFALHAPHAEPHRANTSQSSKLTTLGLHHVALTSTNYEASRNFYTEIMKMQVEWEPDSNNVYLTNGTDNLAIHRGFPQDSRLDHIGFILDSPAHVDHWYEYLTDHNIQIDKEPKTHRDGARSFYVVDPDGVLVQLMYHPPLSKATSNL